MKKKVTGSSYKLWLIAIIILVGSINNIQAQVNTESLKAKDKQPENKTVLKTDAEKDWEYLKYIRSFYSTHEENDRLEKANVFENLKFKDKVNLNRTKLVKAFLEKYPNDSHFDYAVSMFVGDPCHPLFIAEKMTEDQTQFLSSKFQNNSSVKERKQVRRALPIDKEAKERWLKYFNKLAAKILASNASLDRKVLTSMALISRDYKLAAVRYQRLQKEPIEADYWEDFDTYYWSSFQQRMYTLLDTYPDSERLARYIPSFLNNLKVRYPKLVRTYLNEFYIRTGNSNPLAGRAGIKALHKVLADYLAAEEALEQASGLDPLDMDFTAMDGTKVDLTKMRGKVVLIDFWDTRCGPCIKEMPHVQAMYDKYRDQGFEVIGIAGNGDSAKETILKIMEKTNANWPQRLDKGKDATVSYISLYSITSFPTVWLLNKEGVIVDKKARGERLEPLIRKYLGLEKE